MPSSFASLVDSFLKEEYADSPVTASALGIPGHDEDLDDLSAAAFDRRDRSAEEWLRRFKGVADEGLTEDERIDRDFLVAVLRGREILRPQRMWRKQPATYLGPGLNGVFTLFLHRLRPDNELADAARSRLEQVPANLRDGMSNLDFGLTPPIYVERAIAQTRAAVRYARELVPAEVADPARRERITEAGARAATAFETFGAFLEDKRAQASGSYAVGEECYSALLRGKELLPYGAAELRRRGRDQYDLLAAEAQRLAKEIDGSDDWTGASNV